jgi:hypothetical protein
MKTLNSSLVLVVASGLVMATVPGVFGQSEDEKAAQAAARMSAACQVVTEATKVQQTLDRFDSGLAAHDIDQLQAAGIEAGSAKGWQRFFKSNPEAKVTDSCPVTELFIGGDTAIWNCTETSTITSSGKPTQFAHVIRFTFTKKNGEWLISDRR